METYGFKVGDKVIITKSDENWADVMDKCVDMVVTIHSMKPYRGDDFTIKVLEADKNATIDTPEGVLALFNWSYKQGHFRIFEKRVKKLKFKILK